ncbi:NAD-dependent epimerase/dehydratase family protein [Modestobacter muralis]|uniref:NAD-dependent epimerase/dehydratase family protein n=1 Tax=Modestobacter muralis TaxID=1608614 RepID=A0A6P0F5E3_9ACTN|nr:GMC family oxidoreductase [Modestobacter muralis]NEK96458.1 NAD-dependent epimerase/dehydratase family protein [Modestobacter muralis]NEN53358.1 NAD-dependent epimerase/dehydratase family protein [Modestobacter muralis]
MPLAELEAVGDSGLPALRTCDVCVVGTGPAGATLARELSGSGLQVTVLESGGSARTDRADALNEVENVGRPRAEDQWAVRNRVLGGSSHTWGGRCAPFDDVDFAERSWIPGSGWPFGREELDPYLDRAASHLGLVVGTGFEDDNFWALAGRPRPARDPDPELLRSFFWQFSRDSDESYPFEYMRFGRSLARRVGPNVTVVTGATVVRVDPVDSGRTVRSVEYVGPDGRRRTLTAATVVLAAGGIENARILLSSDTVTPDGLGNDHGRVGRYLMDHPRGLLASFDLAGTGELQKRLGRYNVRGRMFRAGYRLSPAVQEAEGLLNCAAWLGEELADDDPWAALRRLAGGKPRLPDDAVALSGNLGFLARGARDYFIERNGVPRKLSALQLLGMVEQRPDADSRVTLSERRDAFGVRLPRIDWRVHPDEPRTMRRMAELVAQEITRLGLPAPTLQEWVRDGADFPPAVIDVAHPTGTTRMAVDPATGVVDANCQVHGVAGLYVAGSSVFPTAGHCNPTHMIVAMAIRLADHLKDVLVRTSVPQVPRGRTLTVLLTGGTGRIGRVVLGDLVARGYRVRATTSRQPPEDHRPEVEWVEFDLLEASASALDELVAGCDAVVHLAAEIGQQDRMQRLNVEATRLLAEAVERAGVRSFTYTSTVSVYGSGRHRTATEDSAVLTVDHDVPAEYWALDYVREYGRTKLAGELALREVARHARYTVFRPAVVVDVDDLVAIRDWGRGKRVLAAHRHAHHVYVRDVAEAVAWSVERSLAGVGEPGVTIYNLAEDDVPEPTHAQFLKRAHAVSGDPRFRVLPVPGAADWLHDFLRFRRSPFRKPLWRMRFPSDRLQAAGFTPRYGMAHAQNEALDRIRLDAGR